MQHIRYIGVGHPTGIESTYSSIRQYMHCDASRTCFGLLNKLQGCSLKVEHAQGSEAVELGTWKSLAFLNHYYDSYLSLEKTTKRSRRSRKRAINFGKPKIQNVFLLLQQLLKAHLHDGKVRQVHPRAMRVKWDRNEFLDAKWLHF